MEIQPGFAQKKQKNDYSDTLQIRWITIDKVFIVGNRKTKEKVIKRELDIREGDSIPYQQIDEILEKNQQRIFNTSLFVTVNVTKVEFKEDKIDVIIRVNERWYWYIFPLFKLADRNFTEWWTNQNRDLSRIDIGLKFDHYNFRGRREKLNVVGQLGYTQLFSLYYSTPAFDKKQQWGFTISGAYATNRNIAVNTVENRLIFLDSEEILREEFTGFATFSYRQSLQKSHSFTGGYQDVAVNDTIPKINPNYFLDGNNKQQAIYLQYSFRSDYRDYTSYPLNGHFFRANVFQNGLGLLGDLRVTNILLNYAKYHNLVGRLYLASSFMVSTTFPERQPYSSYNGLGFGNSFIRGYEVYVINGQHFGLNNNSVKFQLFSTEASIRNLIRIEQFNTIPIAMYLSAFYDQGYVENYKNFEENDRFTNKYLYGFGMGLDIVTFYDFVVRFEYSWNRDGENGLRFNIKSAF